MKAQEELKNILKSKKPISFIDLQKVIYDLKLQSYMDKSDSNTEKEYYFYDGEINAYLNCLDLLKKWKEK